MKAIEVKIGLCITCLHFHEGEEGVDAESRPDGLDESVFGYCDVYEYIRKMPDIKQPGSCLDHQCPMWELQDLNWCPTHKSWSFDECELCMANGLASESPLKTPIKDEGLDYDNASEGEE